MYQPRTLVSYLRSLPGFLTSHVSRIKTPGHFGKGLEHVRVQVNKIKYKDFIMNNMSYKSKSFEIEY